ncbi:hypothetical protein BDD14_5173 [Edaphobacter modestus]|uniref:Uncharacterized protein n=2 Tax=Edaphobacter modestus TaxID=388466 RepID=A0A4V2G548_9BACT|nr:hypothetical protein BDD14_5173 [Edaphobacter modestus]
MKSVSKWCRRVLFVVLVLLGVAWLWSEANQWLLRWRGERLLADIQSLEVGKSSWTDAEALMKKRGLRHLGDSCTPEKCQYGIRMEHTLPRWFWGYPDYGVMNWMPRIADNVGLRISVISAVFTVEKGIVTSKSFWEMVRLPVRDWFLPGSGHMSELSVNSAEEADFSRYYLGFDYKLSRMHPHSAATADKRGLVVTYSPDEDISERAKLMDFRLDCITRFIPCKNEREILPEGQVLLEEHRALLKAKGD